MSDSSKPRRSHGTRVRYRLASVLAASVLVATSFSNPTAFGATATCGAGGNYFAGRGYEPPGYEPRGAKANVSVESAPLCTGGANTDSTAWAMLAGDGSAYQYAQIGHIHKNYGTTPLRFFYEWSKGAGLAFEQVYFGSPVYGNTYSYKASRYPSDGKIHLLLDDAAPPGPACDDTHICITPFDPLDAWPGTNAEWFAETLHPGDDVAGTSTSRTDFDQIRVKKPNDDWVKEDFNFGNPPAFCYYHAQEVTSDSHFEVWTNPSNHNC